MNTLVLATLGAGFAAGLLLLAHRWRTAEPQPPRTSPRRRTVTWSRADTVRWAAATASGVLVGVATGWPVGAVLATLALALLPRHFAPPRAQRRRVARIEAIASWTEMLRDTLSAAAGLEQAILAAAPIAPRPIRPEITALATALRRGQRLPVALAALADGLADPTADLVVAALHLASDHPARDLADLLGELATEARAQAALRLRVEAGRARTRTSVRVILATTLAFTTGLVVFNREFLTPFDTTAGQGVLAAIGALLALAVTWLGRIARDREPDRFLLQPARPMVRAELGEVRS
ncbi:type II secretion system F family protein [Crossiella sp. SN42]|uniref:type II secretion system F family protein n=1 Tax=Crossiella sp. SN42 TaxID=2944808 RepID=UPI00207C41DB|nr:type II secretion system F family protein [Crossiella sp. SN42]MCO1575877.1 type II secretion system F family protein [Crossiella sp. SN42]